MPWSHALAIVRPTEMSAAHSLVLHAAALTALACAAALARADVYKCSGDGGIPVYQEMPCAPGKELRNFQTDPPQITVLPAQPRQSVAPVPAKPAPATEAKAGNDARPGKSALPGGNASERMHLRVGMTEAEVLARLGQPDITTGGRNGGWARWTYMPAPGDPETTTALVLTKGIVTDIERKVVKK